MGELIPQSLKKRLNWLQNTVMALTQFCKDKPEPELKAVASLCFPTTLVTSFPAHSEAYRNCSHIPHVHTQMSQISSLEMVAQEKLGFPGHMHLQVCCNTGEEISGPQDSVQPGCAPPGDKEPSLGPWFPSKQWEQYCPKLP